jgi:Rod binding domain-containing protein
MEPVALSPSLASEKPMHHGMTSADAAKEFETMLVAQLLKMAREAGQIEQKQDEMTGAESYMEFAEQFVAQAIAQSGAFGFANAINTELEKKP